MTASTTQHILVTGATGFLGFRIVEALAEQGEWETIIAAGRTLDPARHVQHPRVTYHLGDLAELGYCREIVQGCSHVVNCASLSSPWGTYDQFYRANVLTQVNLITVCIEEQVKRFVYISTPSMYFNFQDRLGVSEEEPLPPKLINHYAATKKKAEDMIAGSGIEYIALRPRAIIGRGDRVIMPRLLRAHEEGRLRVIGEGTNMMDLTAVSNVVQAVFLSLKAPNASCGEVYNVTNDEPIRLWEGINYTLKALGLKEVKQKIPYRLALSIAQVASLVGKLRRSSKEPAIVPYSIANLARSMTLDISKIKEKLGYRPVQSTYEAIDEFVEWYKQKQAVNGLGV